MALKTTIGLSIENIPTILITVIHSILQLNTNPDNYIFCFIIQFSLVFFGPVPQTLTRQSILIHLVQGKL